MKPVFFKALFIVGSVLLVRVPAGTAKQQSPGKSGDVPAPMPVARSRTPRQRIWPRAKFTSSRVTLKRPLRTATKPSALTRTWPSSYNNRGWAYAHHGQGEFDKAIADYNEALRLNPKLTLVANNRWWANKHLRDRAAAKNCLLQGNAHIKQREFEKAVADCSEAIRLNPNLALAYNSRGWAYAHTVEPQYDKAIADYNEALRLDPKLTLAANNRWWANKHLRDIAAAKAGDADASANVAGNQGRCREPGRPFPGRDGEDPGGCQEGGRPFSGRDCQDKERGRRGG